MATLYTHPTSYDISQKSASKYIIQLYYHAFSLIVLLIPWLPQLHACDI